MKKFIILLIFNVVMIFSLQAQTALNYTYHFDNGINVKSEYCWNHVWVSQSNEALKPTDQTPLALNTRILGDLTSSPSFKLFSSGKEVKVQGAKPGTYTMKVSFKLSGKPGTLSFDVDNIVIKPQNKTTVSVVLYDYQILVEETPGKQNGLSSFISKIDRYKGNAEQNPTCGIPTFYLKGKHDTPVVADENPGKKNGKIKPGTYDVLLTLGSPGHIQKLWLENFTMKPDVSYSITTNLNAGVIEYAGDNKDVKAIHMYPAGTADKQKGTAAPDKNLELIKCESQAITNPCPPGTYDVLLNFNNGARYEWRKNIAVKTGARVQVR
ncbi:MAG: hypothetical protein NTZ85_06000 [Bacteroidia bacterium]|jgi:hypothetical protein|nr:hypothetical protein [Bacteroidia bacterium]